MHVSWALQHSDIYLYAGPFPSGKYLLIFVDEFSRYPNNLLPKIGPKRPCVRHDMLVRQRIKSYADDKRNVKPSELMVFFADKLSGINLHRHTIITKISGTKITAQRHDTIKKKSSFFKKVLVGHKNIEIWRTSFNYEDFESSRTPG